jgi:hypothetical protein
MTDFSKGAAVKGHPFYIKQTVFAEAVFPNVELVIWNCPGG